MNSKVILKALPIACAICLPRQAAAQVQACDSDSAPCYTYTNSGEGAGLAVGNTGGPGGTGLLATSNNGDAISGSTRNAWPYAGVYGTSTAPTDGIGVNGIVKGTSSVGVNGQTDIGAGGVLGTATGSGNGVFGITLGQGTGVLGEVSPAGKGYAIYGSNDSSAGYAGYFSGNVHVTGSISCGSGCTSDVRLKKNVKPLLGALDQLLHLNGVTFEWIDPSVHAGDATVQRGFIAQDVEKFFPNWVKDDGYKAKDGQTYRTLDLRQIEALEVESIRELKVQNDELRAKLETNQARTAMLEERFDALRGGRTASLGGVGLGEGAFLLVGLGMTAAFGISKGRHPKQDA
jgi:hypothetical protein